MAEKDTPAHPWFVERRHLPLIMVVVFVILSAITFYICHRHHTIHTEHILKEDRSAANLLSLVLDEHLKKIVSVMESYSNRPLLLQAVRDKNAEKAKVHLISLIKSDRDIDSVIITDRQGTLWAAYPERPEVLGKNFAYRDWYKDVSKEWKSNISDVYLRIVAEKDLAVSIYVPLFDETGEAIGILVNTHRTVGWSYLLKQVLLDPGADITVTDRKGQIVSSRRHDVEQEIRPYPFHPGMKKAMAAKNETFAVDDPDLGGRTRYISFAPVVNIGWTVFVERDKRSILLSESAFYFQVTAIAFLLFLIIILSLVYSIKQVMAQEILEQLQTEKKIRISEERYKSYIDVTMQLAWTTNDQGEIVEDNPSWSKYTGRGYEEIKGLGWIEDIHPDDRDRTEKIWRKAVAEKSFYETEYRLRRYDGVYRDYLARGVPLLAEDGSVREWVGACIDITERKRVEETLRRSEENFRHSLDDSPMGVRIVTIDGETIYANRAILDIYGYDNIEDLETTPTEKRYTPESHAAFLVRRKKRKQGVDVPSEYTINIIRKDGDVRHLLVLRREILWDGKRQFQVLYNDITDFKRTEAALRESEERLRTIIEASLDAIIAVNVEGRLVLFNGAAQELFQYSEEEALNQPVDILLREEISNIHQERLEKFLKRGVGQCGHIGRRMEKLFRRKDGSLFEAEASMSGGRSNGLRLVVLAIHNITERKRAENALRRAEENFRRSLDDSPLGVRIVTIEGETIYANRAILDFYGDDSIEELKTTPLKERYTLESYAEFQIRKEKRKRGDYYPSEYDISIVRKDGEVRHLHVFRKETLWNGERQFQVLYNDITERKQAVEAVHASREQLRALAGRLQAVREEERTQIAREIHDELGGALTSLKIDFSLLTRAALKIENQTVRTSLLAGMDSMIKFIDATIHTVRRIAMELRPGILDDLGLVAALEWQLKDFEKRTGIRCEFIPPAEDISLDADLSTALFRIFQEALTNVARHSGATEVRVRLHTDGDSSVLEVKDNGKGIEKEKALSSKSLGLLGMRERAQMFGGRLTVTGAPGRGTKVTVEISPVEKRKMDRDQGGAAG